MSTPPNDEKAIPAQEEGSGPRDNQAPVEGAQLRSPPDDSWAALIKSLPKKDRAKAVNKLLKANPDLRPVRRDKVRRSITYAVIAAIVVDGLVAAYLTAVADTWSLDSMKDWLTLSAIPFTTALTVVLAFWFPSRESD